MRNRWDRIAAHLAAGVRLRRRSLPAPAGPTALRLRVEGVDALLTSDGRIAHAVGSAREAATREQLRAAAVAVDRARSALRRKDPDSAVALWKALVDGRWSLVDRFDTDGRRFLVAQRNEIPTPKRRGLRQREAAVLALRAQGHSLKLIGYELGVGQSIVARDLALGMKRLGLESIADLVRLYARPAAASE
jgi:DNA-binding CsgD family transcriptional regulator